MTSREDSLESTTNQGAQLLTFAAALAEVKARKCGAFAVERIGYSQLLVALRPAADCPAELTEVLIDVYRVDANSSESEDTYFENESLADLPTSGYILVSHEDVILALEHDFQWAVDLLERESERLKTSGNRCSQGTSVGVSSCECIEEGVGYLV